MNQPGIRPLAENDLNRITTLDREAGGASRRDFFSRRWQAMQAHPERYIGLVAETGTRVAGFVIAHVLEGEFGATEPVAVLDSLAVQDASRGRGLGHGLVTAFKEEARRRGCREIRSQVGWEQQPLLAFFARSGFLLAPRTILERPVDTRTGEAR